MNFFTKSAWSAMGIVTFSLGTASAQTSAENRGTPAPTTPKSVDGGKAEQRGAQSRGNEQRKSGGEDAAGRPEAHDPQGKEEPSPPEALAESDSGTQSDESENPVEDTGSSVPSADAKADTVAACLSNHERAQLARLSGGFLESIRELKACADPKCPQALRDDCLSWRQELSSMIPTIIVVAEGDEGDMAVARVIVDDEVLRTELDGRPIALNPGTHVIKLEHPDGSTREQHVVLSEGEQGRRIAFSFKSAPVIVAPNGSTPTMTIRPIPAGVYILGASAFVGLGVGVGFGSDAWSKSRTARDVCAPLCAPEVSRAVTERAVVADVALGIAVASTIGAVVLYSYRAERIVPVEHIAIGWTPGPRGGAVGLKGAF